MRTWKKIVVAPLLAWAAACGDDGDAPSPAQDPSSTCERICARSAAARCGGDTPNCVDLCEAQIGATPAACDGALEDVSRCLSGATFRCDADDESEAPTCRGALNAWASCLERNGADFPDDPEPAPEPAPEPGEGAVCDAEAGDDACTRCQKESCCDAVSACDGACQDFVTCVDACAIDDDACLGACGKASPSGVAAFQAVFQCAALSCGSECELVDSVEEPSPVPGEHDTPSVCLDIEVSAEDNCAGTGKAYAYDCMERPYNDCVDSPTGFTGVYCCDE